MMLNILIWLINTVIATSYKHVGILVIFSFIVGHSDSTVYVLKTSWKSINGVLIEQPEDKTQ
jgi:hypothetical protein